MDVGVFWFSGVGSVVEVVREIAGGLGAGAGVTSGVSVLLL